MQDVVVVGGASRMPGLRAHLEKMFPRDSLTRLHMTDAALNAVRQHCMCCGPILLHEAHSAAVLWQHL